MKTNFTAIVRTSEWAGSETFTFNVLAGSESAARKEVESLIGRDLPQGGQIVSLEKRGN